MSATMRTTLQTVPESLPADHVTNASGTTTTATAPTETTSKSSSHSHSNASSLKTRSSSAKVSVVPCAIHSLAARIVDKTMRKIVYVCVNKNLAAAAKLSVIDVILYDVVIGVIAASYLHSMRFCHLFATIFHQYFNPFIHLFSFHPIHS